MDKFEIKKYIYYAIIGVISLIMLVFIPMLGTNVGLGFEFPDTSVGWCIWVMTKLIASLASMAIFYCFLEQAKINIKDNDKYIKANEILLNSKMNNTLNPRSPKKWIASQYSTKGVALFISSFLSALVLTNAILTFDYIVMLTYLFVLISSVIFGIMEMKSAEAYWTNEFYQYAVMIEDDIKNNKKILQEDINKCLNSMEKNVGIYKNK